MDWKSFWLVFGTVFIAELGDKTQLGVLNFSASGRSPALVFAAASLGLVASTLIGVFAGHWLGRYIPPRALKLAGAVLFIGIGVWMLFDRD